MDLLLHASKLLDWMNWRGKGDRLHWKTPLVNETLNRHFLDNQVGLGHLHPVPLPAQTCHCLGGWALNASEGSSMNLCQQERSSRMKGTKQTEERRGQGGVGGGEALTAGPCLAWRKGDRRQPPDMRGVREALFKLQRLKHLNTNRDGSVWEGVV